MAPRNPPRLSATRFPSASESGWALPTRGRLRRFLERRRRLLISLLLCVAAGAAVHQLTPPSSARVPTLVAASDLPAGTVLGPSSFRLARLPPDAVPAGTLTDSAALAGQRLASPLRQGQVILDTAVVGPGLLSGTAPGTAAVPLRIADPASLSLLKAGQLVDIVLSRAVGSGEQTETLAAAVPVLWTSGPEEAAGGWPGAGGEKGLMVVAAPASEAELLAGASARGKLFFALVPHSQHGSPQ